MGKLLSFTLDADELAEFQAAVTDFNEKFDRSRARMAKDDEEIARLEAESRADWAEIRDLRVKTQASIAEMNAIVEQMRAL